LRTWRSASELNLDLPGAPELRRISEWPCGYAPGTFVLSHIDPFSITIVRPHAQVPDSLTGNDGPRQNVGPKARLNILACGLGAPVISEMLLVGSYLANPRCQGLEDLVVLTEIHPELNLPWNGSFPAGLDPYHLAHVLVDSDTRIDAIVSYDIDSKDAARELKRIREVRDLYRPHCRFVVQTRFPTVDTALREFGEIRTRRAGITAAAFNLYQEVITALMTQTDIDPDGYL
jgi:hypothetical protein